MRRRARSDLSDRTIVAPVDGLVETLFYSAGETAAAGVPVLSIIPVDALEVKFYVGETERVNLKLGRHRVGDLRRLRGADLCDAHPSRVAAAVHAAGDLQPR